MCPISKVIKDDYLEHYSLKQKSKFDVPIFAFRKSLRNVLMVSFF
jgi:hypothetical protein